MTTNLIHRAVVVATACLVVLFAGSATAQMLSDNYSGCVALGQYFVNTVGKEGKYAELLGLVGDNNTWNRSKGFHSVADRYPGLKMVAQQTAEFDRAKALEVTESILQKNPDINAVFRGNDAMAMDEEPKDDQR